MARLRSGAIVHRSGIHMKVHWMTDPCDSETRLAIFRVAKTAKTVKNAERQLVHFTDGALCALFELKGDLSPTQFTALALELRRKAEWAGIVFVYDHDTLKKVFAAWVAQVMHMGYGAAQVAAFAEALVPGITPAQADVYHRRIAKEYFALYNRLIEDEDKEIVDLRLLGFLRSEEHIAEVIKLHDDLWGLRAPKDQSHFLGNLARFKKKHRSHGSIAKALVTA